MESLQKPFLLTHLLFVFAFFFISLNAVSSPRVHTITVEDQNYQATGVDGTGTDCSSKQQALQLQLKVCREKQTHLHCLDKIYPEFTKKFPKCKEEAAAACLEQCVVGMPYSYCTKFCK